MGPPGWRVAVYVHGSPSDPRAPGCTTPLDGRRVPPPLPVGSEPAAARFLVIESSAAPTTVVHLIADPSSTRMDATFERTGNAVRLRSVACSHAVELPKPLLTFPYHLAEAEKALLG